MTFRRRLKRTAVAALPLLAIVVGGVVLTILKRGVPRSQPVRGGVSFVGLCASPTGTGPLPRTELGDYDHVLVQAPDRLEAVLRPHLVGRCSIRVQVRHGDTDVGATDRAEMSGARRTWQNGQEVWYLLAFMIDPVHPFPPPGGWMLVHQFYAEDLKAHVDGGSPPVAIEITPSGKLELKVRGGRKVSSESVAPRDEAYTIAAAVPAVWHVLLLHINWSTSADGRVVVWHRVGRSRFSDAPQVVARGSNLLTVAGHVLPVYAESGIYRSRTRATQTVYYARFVAEPTRRAAMIYGLSEH